MFTEISNDMRDEFLTLCREHSADPHKAAKILRVYKALRDECVADMIAAFEENF